MLQKVEDRAGTLSKMDFADVRDKEMWEKILTLDMVSSEESGTDDGEEVLIVRPIPWRSARVHHMFRELDRQSLTDKSPQSRRQMKRRVLGENSTRPQCNRELPQWAYSA